LSCSCIGVLFPLFFTTLCCGWSVLCSYNHRQYLGECVPLLDLYCLWLCHPHTPILHLIKLLWRVVPNQVPLVLIIPVWTSYLWELSSVWSLFVYCIVVCRILASLCFSKLTQQFSQILEELWSLGSFWCEVWIPSF
jgi:hypothetical protein